MNEMIEKMISRHAIRRFQTRQIEEEVLEQILQAGLYAPRAPRQSAQGRQNHTSLRRRS